MLDRLTQPQNVLIGTRLNKRHLRRSLKKLKEDQRIGKGRKMRRRRGLAVAAAAAAATVAAAVAATATVVMTTLIPVYKRRMKTRKIKIYVTKETCTREAAQGRNVMRAITKEKEKEYWLYRRAAPRC